MLDRITVARRAKLGDNLKNKFDSAIMRLKTGLDYFKIIQKFTELDIKQREFHNSNYLMGIFSVLEVYISDVTYELIICFPGHIQNKSFDLEIIANVGSALGIIKESAKRSVYELTYKTFKEIVEHSLSKFDRKASLEELLIDNINEIKCSRDVYAHSNGISNEIYERKAGKLARERAGRILTLDDNYLFNSTEKIQEFIEKFHAVGPSKFLEYNKKKAFEEMWNMTWLSKIFKFEDMWDKVPGEDMIRPKEVSWGWSHSEKALLDFFYRIYFGDSDSRITTNMVYTLQKWPLDSREGQVMLSWLDSPFYF